MDFKVKQHQGLKNQKDWFLSTQKNCVYQKILKYSMKHQ